ncbi:regulator of chromosome condensation 1/beta-lactamase-inhibitor protein II [Zopfochytrium polystomum]|nr:regulator of chromosome condensation 1/beta-lactamase-inhibitor protein II [Zopfochytrium polystomum]
MQPHSVNQHHRPHPRRHSPHRLRPHPTRPPPAPPAPARFMPNTNQLALTARPGFALVDDDFDPTAATVAVDLPPPPATPTPAADGDDERERRRRRRRRHRRGRYTRLAEVPLVYARGRVALQDEDEDDEGEPATERGEWLWGILGMGRGGVTGAAKAAVTAAGLGARGGRRRRRRRRQRDIAYFSEIRPDALDDLIPNHEYASRIRDLNKMLSRQAVLKDWASVYKTYAASLSIVALATSFTAGIIGKTGVAGATTTWMLVFVSLISASFALSAGRKGPKFLAEIHETLAVWSATDDRKRLRWTTELHKVTMTPALFGPPPVYLLLVAEQRQRDNTSDDEYERGASTDQDDEDQLPSYEPRAAGGDGEGTDPPPVVGGDGGVIELRPLMPAREASPEARAAAAAASVMPPQSRKVQGRMLFAFGSNGSGQLGTAEAAVDARTPLPVFYAAAAAAADDDDDARSPESGTPATPPPEPAAAPPPSLLHRITFPVLTLATGANHTLLVCAATGALFAAGSNSHGQLGLSVHSPHHHYLHPHFVRVPLPADVEIADNDRIVQVACGTTHSALRTAAGAVVTFGSGAHGELGHDLRNTAAAASPPRRVSAQLLPPTDAAVAIAAGHRYTLVLLASGALRCLGAAGARTLGLSAPGLGPPAPHIVAIAGSGHRHAVAIGDDGVDGCGVYTIGTRSPHGELGPGFNNAAGEDDGGNDSSSRRLPAWLHRVALPLRVDERATRVFAGWGHSGAQTDAGRVFMWGRRERGQVPVVDGGDRAAWDTPVEVAALRGCEMLAFGAESGVALAAAPDAAAGGEERRKKVLVAWGWNEHGNCGVAAADDGGGDVLVPTEVCADAFEGRRVTGVWAGYASVFVQTDGGL